MILSKETGLTEKDPEKGWIRYPPCFRDLFVYQDIPTMRTRAMGEFIASDCTRDGKLYVSAVFDCFDSSVIGLAMDTNMKTPLCVKTLEHTAKVYPGIREAIIHSDRCHDNTAVKVCGQG